MVASEGFAVFAESFTIQGFARFARDSVRIFHGLPAESRRRDYALTIGNFDGVHRGHQQLLAQLRDAARVRGLPTMVCTFEPHPREYFAALAQEQARSIHGAPAAAARASAPARIATLRDKIEALAACGADAVCVLRFDAQLAAMLADAFISDVLVHGLRARHLLIGDDFRFGARRAGDFALLCAAGSRYGFSVERMPTITDTPAPQADAVRVSSSSLREALAAGDMTRANALLGRPYAVSGRVLHGRKLGRKLGFPTLNQRLWRPGVHVLARPALAGVFAVRVHGLDRMPLPGVASLGTRPAVEQDGAWLLETHVFDFARDVYGACVRVEFAQKLRDEAHYDTLDALTAQIDRDACAARRVLSATGARRTAST